MTDYQQEKLEGKTGESGSFFQKVKNMAQGADKGDAPESSASDKRKVISSLLLGLGLMQTLYMNLTAFFPTYAMKYYYWVDSGRIGIILAMF